jgi:hypothetical protein
MDELAKKSKRELIEICKNKSIKGYSSKKKEDIINLILNNNNNNIDRLNSNNKLQLILKCKDLNIDKKLYNNKKKNEIIEVIKHKLLSIHNSTIDISSLNDEKKSDQYYNHDEKINDADIDNDEKKNNQYYNHDEKINDDEKSIYNNSYNDISIKELINNSPIKKWIKYIDFNNLILYENYNNKDLFKKVGIISIDNEKNNKDEKKRQTLIKFEHCINVNEYNEGTEWIYIFTIKNMIVKIGGTRNGLRNRINSYLCGHHIPERYKSGDCSKTNAFIYNTFLFYLELEYNIEMYGYKLPISENKVKILNKEVSIKIQTYHAYESIILEDYKKIYGLYPILSDNADPNYKN